MIDGPDSERDAAVTDEGSAYALDDRRWEGAAPTPESTVLRRQSHEAAARGDYDLSMELAARSAAAFNEEGVVAQERQDALAYRLLSALRVGGWAVAVHNDYRLNGEAHTFWLLTHANGRYVKGEGRTDAVAIQQCYAGVADLAAAENSARLLSEAALRDAFMEGWATGRTVGVNVSSEWADEREAAEASTAASDWRESESLRRVGQAGA